MEAEIQVKSDNVIQLKENKDILKLRIRDIEGNDTGEFLVFDLEDIELLTRWQELVEKDKLYRKQLKNEFTIIDKRQDHKGKKLLSANEEAKVKAMQEFYKKEVEIYDMFLGKGGIKKLLNGRNLSWGFFDEVDEIINEVIMPKLNINADSIKNKIVSKYSTKDKRDDVIE